ncbi:MAG: glycosyltransferase, partial [Candidatus Aminicenantes bacterium]
IYIREPRIKWLETLAHTFLAMGEALLRRRQFDVYLVCNLANSPLLWLLRVARLAGVTGVAGRGKKVFLNVDGMEWKRSKWNKWGKSYYRLAAWLAVRSGAELIADSRAVGDYYLRKYGKKPHYISYGCELWESKKPALLKKLGVEPGEFILQVTRFEPENNVLLTLRAFKKLESSKKLVVVGDAVYESSYTRTIKKEAGEDNRIIRTGFIYDRELLRELFCNCAFYVHGNEVGGTNPSLLEAMGAGCFVVARDVPFNREVLREAGIYYQKDEEDLRQKMEWALRPENSRRVRAGRVMAREIIRQDYQWDKVANEYVRLFGKEINKK